MSLASHEHVLLVLMSILSLLVRPIAVESGRGFPRPDYTKLNTP